MSKRPLIPGERHHWWPKSLSQFWTDANGKVSRIDSAGNVSRSSPTKTARISDGHNLRFGSPWDTTFEHEFGRPDGEFPRLVELLCSIVNDHRDAQIAKLEYHAHTCNDSDLESLVECLVSLAVRSPRFRQGVVSFVSSLRANVGKTEYAQLTAANLYDVYRSLTERPSPEGKFVVIWSSHREFVYGDGFYSNLYVSSHNLMNARALVPLTPSIAVLFARPMEYVAEPRLMSIEANDDLIRLINTTTQIYSGACLFFRTEQPVLSEHFRHAGYLRYADADPVEQLVSQIPGVKARQVRRLVFD